jgi:hypothetical protein
MYFCLCDSSNKQVTSPSSSYNVKGKCLYNIPEPYVLLVCHVQATEIILLDVELETAFLCEAGFLQVLRDL